MATFKQLPSGNWRAQVRRKGRYISETFRRRKDADEWALDVERQIDRGEAPRASRLIEPTTVEDLIELHLADMKEVGKCPRRSKAFTLGALKKALGRVRFAELDRQRLIRFRQVSSKTRSWSYNRRHGLHVFEDRHLACRRSARHCRVLGIS